MIVSFTENGWEDFCYWQAMDSEIQEKIILLIKEISRSPYKGLGKPEPLKGNLSGWWSRRINDEHRLVYQVSGKEKKIMIINQCRFHY
jgi:toxin YoeB